MSQGYPLPLFWIYLSATALIQQECQNVENRGFSWFSCLHMCCLFSLMEKQVIANRIYSVKYYRNSYPTGMCDVCVCVCLCFTKHLNIQEHDHRGKGSCSPLKSCDAIVRVQIPEFIAHDSLWCFLSQEPKNTNFISVLLDFFY